MKQTDLEFNYCEYVKLAVHEDVLEMRPARDDVAICIGVLSSAAMVGLIPLSLAALQPHAPEVFHVSTETEAEKRMSLISLCGSLLSLFLGWRIGAAITGHIRWKLVLDKAVNQVRINDREACRLTDISYVCSGLSPDAGYYSMALILANGRKIQFCRGYWKNPTFKALAQVVSEFVGVEQHNRLMERHQQTTRDRENRESTGK